MILQERRRYHFAHPPVPVSESRESCLKKWREPEVGWKDSDSAQVLRKMRKEELL